eukprot:scaffold6322_cov59-Cylindrotheca_fusiformis.AAC.23
MKLLSLLTFSAVVVSARISGRRGQQLKDRRDLLKLPGNQSACDVIHPDRLPKECLCHEPDAYGLVIECVKPFNSSYFNDTIGMKISLDPCNPDGSSLSFDLTEQDHGIDMRVAGIRAGEEKNIPIPGLSIIVPSAGNFGVDVAVLIYGNPDMLSVKVGLNACLAAGPHEFCASAVPGLTKIFPWYVLAGTYSFGHYCNATEAVILDESSEFLLPQVGGERKVATE